MRLLLDTHALLWALYDHPRLGTRARELFSAPQEQLFVSVVSAWEMAIKKSLGKLQLSMPVERLVAERLPPLGVSLLPVTMAHVGRVESLPFHHRDPFDRMLAAQALTEGLVLVSADAAFDAYGVIRLW
jgi:PIN domain nuclease of toxin-antitoxin system